MESIVLTFHFRGRVSFKIEDFVALEVGLLLDNYPIPSNIL